jgi:hypothetical protein
MLGKHGGARPGAGRPRGSGKPKLLAACPPGMDPIEFLLSVMTDASIDIRLRIQAAKAVLPYCAKRPAEVLPAPDGETGCDSWDVILGGKK